MKSTIIICVLQFFITFAVFAQVNIFTESQSVQAGSIISVPVYAESSQSLELIAFQFAINWDNNLLEYQSVSDFGIGSLDENAFGIPGLTEHDDNVTVAWEDYPNVFFINSRTQLFNINFRVKDNFTADLSTEISFCTNCTTEFYNHNLNALDLNHQNAQISVSSLPIELITFEAKIQENNTVRLDWFTATETNNSHFEIERSADNKSWTVIGKVASKGTTNFKQNYQFQDKNPLIGHNFYRLKQVDLTGKFTYSDIRQVTMSKENPVLKWNNPVANVLFLEYTVFDESKLTLDLFNVDGKLIKTQSFASQDGINSLEWQMSDLPSGVYWIKTNITSLLGFKIVKQ